jgi:hypothetical protein
MVKLKLTGLSLGRVYNSRSGRWLCRAIVKLLSKTAKLNVENYVQTTFKLSPIKYRTPRPSLRFAYVARVDGSL